MRVLLDELVFLLIEKFQTFKKPEYAITMFTESVRGRSSAVEPSPYPPTYAYDCNDVCSMTHATCTTSFFNIDFYRSNNTS
jgi:hypothetical protein